ncbi:MAG: YqgE/AlgH family protein [Chitinophagales bacterium]|nr:YqgE/AlgH family protein [Chitinophagales bacterium]
MIQNTTKPATGQLLLSEPFMPDPNFKRTVVLLCEHIEDGGTVGFILNRTLQIKVCDALVDFDEIQNDLYYGGPVAQDTLHYLHRHGELIEDSLHITDDIYWGGNFEQLTNMIKAGSISPNHIKFFLGYSGWSPGQLEHELKENSWIVTQAKSNYAFQTNEKELWKKVLDDMGGEYKMITNYPENPTLN